MKWFDAWVAVLVVGFLVMPATAILRGWPIVESGAWIGLVGAVVIGSLGVYFHYALSREGTR